MAEAKRTAQVVWNGSLREGGGKITSTGSGTLSNLDVTWASRTEDPGGKTSPEELIAAAHAACFSMGLSAALAGGGNAPDELTVDATSTFVVDQDGPRISTMHFDVKGKVPGIDQAAFESAVQGAAEGCPVSKAFKGNVEITADAQLV
jgi:osmotically inducible protein OsmC